jgi:hypothetical protein
VVEIELRCTHRPQPVNEVLELLLRRSCKMRSPRHSYRHFAKLADNMIECIQQARMTASTQDEEPFDGLQNERHVVAIRIRSPAIVGFYDVMRTSPLGLVPFRDFSRRPYARKNLLG